MILNEFTILWNGPNYTLHVLNTQVSHEFATMIWAFEM